MPVHILPRRGVTPVNPAVRGVLILKVRTVPVLFLPPWRHGGLATLLYSVRARSAVNSTAFNLVRRRMPRTAETHRHTGRGRPTTQTSVWDAGYTPGVRRRFGLYSSAVASPRLRPTLLFRRPARSGVIWAQTVRNHGLIS
jgi:hypothetical protein